MSKKKKNKNNYFTDETEKALLLFNAEHDDEIRNEIFNEHLEYPLYKLSENLINMLKCYYISEDFKEIQQVAVNHMIEKMKTHPIDPLRGKAYSYLTKITFHFLIQANRKAYKEIVRKKKITTIKDVVEIETQHESLYFYDFLVEYLEHNSSYIFLDDVELSIVDAITVIMRRTHNFDNLNKKKIYLYIKEMLDLKNNAKITDTKKKLQALYSHLFVLYESQTLTIDYIPTQEIFNTQ